MTIFDTKELYNRLREILNYDSESGIFTWKVKPNRRIKIGQVAGRQSRDGYIRIRVDRTLYLAHRLAWLYHYGTFPEQEIDHINRNKLDNSIGNLRDVCRSTNNRNKDTQSNNSSGVAGVSFDKKRNRWRANIGVDGKVVSLGYFVEFHEAVNARKNAEVLYGFQEDL